ncbi:MAG: alpha/beta hydrolase [Deltaproteobacteria bacterium]|nr:alpha/beta hydrolase [Deltaproteobacteria bacterium]
MRLILFSVVVLFSCGGCVAVEFEEFWMDHPATQDPALRNPDVLTSTKAPVDDVEKDLPVLVMVNGFSGSTYSFEELTQEAERRGVLTSNVLLGGHGESIEAWTQTTWQDWSAPLVDELRALDDAGYINIHVLAYSTGATLLFQAMAEDSFADLRPWRSIIAVSPLVLPLDKELYNLRNGGQLCGNFPVTGLTDDEKARYYVNRPFEAMNQLLSIVETFEASLAAKIAVPEQTEVILLQGTDDVAVDPLGPGLLNNGLSASFEPAWLDTKRHGFLRTKGRDDLDDNDILTQEHAFSLIFN